MNIDRRLQDAERRAAEVEARQAPACEPFPDDVEAAALRDQLERCVTELPGYSEASPRARMLMILADRDATVAANALARRLAGVRDEERKHSLGHYV